MTVSHPCLHQTLDPAVLFIPVYPAVRWFWALTDLMAGPFISVYELQTRKF